jgi:hypothetical protein
MRILSHNGGIIDALREGGRERVDGGWVDDAS